MSVRSSPHGSSSGSHPNSDDFSPKSNTLPEVKAIQSKRLYKVVKEAISKLEQNNQHRRNLLSLFQPEQTRLRYKLREACEKLLFVYPTDLSKKAEEIMWKIVFYEVITAVKNGRKFVSNAPGVLQQRDLVPYFKQFLDSAIGFYQHLLLKLQEICPGLIELDYPLVMRPFSNTSRHSHNSRSTKGSDQKEIEKWAKMICYRLLTCLGDLSRYQMEYGGKECRAKRFYQLALLAQPKAGMPYNQIATVVGNNKWWGLTAAYYYCCALQAKIKYDGAEANFQLLFDRNKRTFYRLTNNDALENVANTQLHKSHHTRIFVISFLYLCDLLKPKTYSTDSEITGLCKRLVDAFPVCLANLRRCNRESNELDTDSNNHDGSSSVKFPDSNSGGREDAARNYDATLNQQKEKVEQQPSILTDEVIFHICVMCLVNVHDLRACRTKSSSAAIVFTLSLFSNLLEHCIRLCKLKDDDASKHNNDESGKNDTKVGDEINFADGDCKCQQQQTQRQLIDAKQQQRPTTTTTTVPQSHKKRDHQHPHHRSRRRRRPNPGGGSEDAADLSEGEEMGAGDAESDSDDSDDADRVSFSSNESRDQLSQDDETLTSQDEDDADDVIKEDKNNSVVADPLPPTSNVVGSLQNTDKKPSQPSPRRQIVLAPSFLRPMSTTLPSKTTASVESRKIEAVTTTTTPVVSDQQASTSTTCNHAHNNAKNKEETKEKSGCGGKKKIYFNQLVGRNFLTASVKLLADWLSVNEAVAQAGNPRALWYRLSTLVNMLPDEHQMSKQVKESGSSNLKKQLNQVDAAAASTEILVVDSRQQTENEERDEQENAKSSTTKNDGEMQQWKQLSYLPEDLLLQYMSMVEEANKFSQLCNLPPANPPHTEQPDYDQLAIRICRLRGLCRQYATVDDIDIKIATGTCGREKFEALEDNVIDTEEELNAIESMRKKRMMKDMAASRLRTECAALESSLISEQQRDSALCLFLVPDVSSLCHDLTTIRRLASCGRYIVIISKTVIDGLDAIKKESQGARDAIRYLETEFKKRNRFVKPQHSNEVVVGVEGEPTKLRNQDVRVWRLYRIIECCRYLMKREAKKQGLDAKEQEGLVTVLMHELTGSNGTSKLFERAILSAKSFGIQVSKTSVFERSRTRRTS